MNMVSWSAVGVSIGNRSRICLTRRLFHTLRGQEMPNNNALFLKVARVPESPVDMGRRLYPLQGTYQRIFTKDYVKKHYGVLPIIGLMGFWAVGLAGYCCYALATRDIEINRKNKPFWSRMDLLEPYPVKMITINEKYPPMEELHELLAEMEEASKEACKK